MRALGVSSYTIPQLARRHTSCVDSCKRRGGRNKPRQLAPAQSRPQRSHVRTVQHITSHHITSYHILSHHINSYQITSHYITCRMRLKHAEYSARGNQHRLPIAFHNVLLRRILEEETACVVTCNAPTPRPAAWSTSKTPGINTCGPASRHGTQARAHGPERRTCSPIASMTRG